MNPVISDLIKLLVTFIVLSVIVIFEEKIKVTRPGFAKAIDVLVNTLMILVIYLVRNIVLGTIAIVDPTDDSWMLTGLGYGFYIPMLPCVHDIMITIGSTRRMVKLMHDATFLLVAIGVKSPQGYVIFSYQMDQEMGFCKGECAICLMEYETKEKCALLNKCGHTFHHKCLHENLAVSNTCPLCRQYIKDSAPETKKNSIRVLVSNSVFPYGD